MLGWCLLHEGLLVTAEGLACRASKATSVHNLIPCASQTVLLFSKLRQSLCDLCLQRGLAR